VMTRVCRSRCSGDLLVARGLIEMEAELRLL
jgi:hypothetical protein